MNIDKQKAGEKFQELIDIVIKLRGPDGCPWDKEQTHSSLMPYFLEEAYEVIESVDHEDWDTLKEELGDIMLHVVLQSQISTEEKKFNIVESLDGINKKLVRRHPHVFCDKNATESFTAKQNWEAAKHEEKNRKSRLDGVPVILPALTRAQRLQEKASYTGFDWDKVEQVWDKVHEEILELKEAHSAGTKNHIEEEIGDVLFAIVNLGRFLKISSEDALRKTNKKFKDRFSFIEKALEEQGRTVDDASLEEMESLWNEKKLIEKN